jgi:prepilin peptidase CpaA
MTITSTAATLGILLFALAMVYAGVMDLLTLKIRNALVAAIGFGWLILAPLAGFGPADLVWNVGIAACVFVLTFIFFALGWIGGGDAKLAAVAALWFQPYEALLFFIYASLLGGLLTLVILQLRTKLLPAVFYRLAWVAQFRDTKSGVPYGAAMAPAALIVLPQTTWVAHAAF